MSDNNTLDYYNLHTADFVNTTQNVDFHEIQELFLSFLPAKAKILDFKWKYCGRFWDREDKNAKIKRGKSKVTQGI